MEIGECGLDYLRIKGDQDQDKKRQRDIFEAQLELAVEANKPLMIHCRDAHEHMLDILKSKKRDHGEKLRGNIHFFTGSSDIAKRYFDLQFTVSFTGVITFAHEYDEVVRYAPDTMILSETDCPFVAPVPYRGKRCEPVFVREVVHRIAAIRDTDPEIMAETLVKNTFRLFKIKE